MGFDAGDMPLQCSLKELLAFFTVVASSQISPHTRCEYNSFVIFSAKVIPFLFIPFYVCRFFSLSSCFLTQTGTGLFFVF
jgi:hypothetical protein